MRPLVHSAYFLQLVQAANLLEFLHGKNTAFSHFKNSNFETHDLPHGAVGVARDAALQTPTKA